MFRKLSKIAGILLLTTFMVCTLAFTSLEYKNVSCQDIEIQFHEGDNIKVQYDELIKLISAADENIRGKRFNQIDARKIEEAIETHDAILNAEVYKVVTTADTSTFKGVLAVSVKHREPIVRIMSSGGDYYLDKSGGKIPVSPDYTARVLVTTGAFNEKFAKEKLLPFILHIENDEFWEAQIEQVHVERNGDIVFTPLVGNHIVEMGSVENYKEKLRNMKAFYKKVLADNNWNKYKSVSLKYKDQVIAKRR